MEKVWKLFLVVGGSALSYVFGGWTMLLEALFFAVVLDYVTGMLASFTEGKLNSTIGFRRLPKKVLIFVVVAVGHLVDRVLGEGSTLVMDGATIFYLLNELLSIIENCGRAGLPVPNVLVKAIQVLREKNGIDDPADSGGKGVK